MKVRSASTVAFPSSGRSPHLRDSADEGTRRLAIPWLFIDLAFYAVTVGLSFFSACLLFSHARLIVPLVIPIVSVTIGALATALRERELETSYWLKVQLKQAAEKLQLENEKHVIELRAQAAESQTRQIEQAESIRKDFVRKINHDLKAPVTVMSWTLAKWKTEGLACATAERKLERMVRTCDRLVSLLHELASNYEHAADAGDAPNDVCELNEVLSNCFSVAQSLAESRCSHLQLALAQRRLWVSVTELKLSRVFDNLIRNAIIHNPPGTSVFIEVQSRAHRHQITVRDNGIGIDTELLDKIFEPVDSAGREHLGLPIVKSFVEKAGGTITVFSKKGLGTTFTICLPSLNLAAGGDSCEHDLTMRGYAGRSGSRSARGDSGSVEPLGLTPATTLVAPEAMLVAAQAMLVADQATLVAPEAVLVAPEAMLVAPEAMLVAPETMLVAPEAMLVAPETTLVTSVPAPSGAPVPQRQAVHV